ncbi:S-layer homology domain-containing protein [Candidatus Microthrix sp.]|uniref:S-layer homology domain-containing protein n=1 Tax=Candidatus Neomicrothrix sp. TaxID=2719034 RepID=UPI0025BA5C77|nr:S-layer homology domain-containing protein [Candidatus Microthrix sp.]
MAVFLWTNAGQPTPTPPHSFSSDVPTDSYHNDAVSWLVRTGVTSGTAPGKYRPTRKVTRSKWPPSSGSTTVDPEPPLPRVQRCTSFQLLQRRGQPAGRNRHHRRHRPGKYSPNAKVTRFQMAVFLKNNPAASHPSPGDRYHHPHKLRSARSIIEPIRLVPTERAAFGPKTTTHAARGRGPPHRSGDRLGWASIEPSGVAPYLTMGLG